MAFINPALAPPPGLIVPLARRPWGLWLLPLLPAAGLAQLLAEVQHGSRLPGAAQWGLAAGLAYAAGASCWYTASLAVADYDANYLYLLEKTGTRQIPLGSFFQLQGSRGYWRLHYRNGRGQPKKLEIFPLGGGLFQAYDATSMPGFIDAIWQHNPQLLVRHG